jgi:hypothetical protein
VTFSATRLFPLVLMLALALVTFWLERTVREEQPHPRCAGTIPTTWWSNSW